MSCPARIPATGELAFSTPRRTAAGTAARTRGRRAVGLQANCRATILQHVDQARRHTELPPFVARQSGARRCDHDGCAEPATNRAPRTRDDPEEFLWFCREHARVYNASWNWCAGMSQDEIESRVRRDTVWDRPTWPLGGSGRPAEPDPDDPLDLFGRRRQIGSAQV